MRPLNIAVILLVLLAGVGAVTFAGVRRHNQALAKAAALTGGNPRNGPAVALQFGCAGCHQIKGVRGPGGRVGPPLSDMAQRVYVGGVVANTPANLVAWIFNPKQINPKTAMPVTGISEAGARDMAAYLLSLR